MNDATGSIAATAGIYDRSATDVWREIIPAVACHASAPMDTAISRSRPERLAASGRRESDRLARR